MTDYQYLPMTLFMTVAILAILIKPILTVLKKIVSPIVYITYITAVGIVTAVERSNTFELDNVIQFTPIQRPATVPSETAA